MRSIVLLWLKALTPWAGDIETPDERLNRLANISISVESAINHATCAGPWASADWCTPVWHGPPLVLARLAAATGYAESAYARHVHEGRCRLKLGECDAYKLPGGVLAPGAVSVWQLQRTEVTWADWREMSGTGEWSTYLSAYAAVRVLAAGYRRCRTIEGALASYRRPSVCFLNGKKARLSIYERLERISNVAISDNSPMSVSGHNRSGVN